MHEVINRSRELSGMFHVRLIIITQVPELTSTTVQWKAWLTHTRVHPPTLEVCTVLLTFPGYNCLNPALTL